MREFVCVCFLMDSRRSRKEEEKKMLCVCVLENVGGIFLAYQLSPTTTKCGRASPRFFFSRFSRFSRSPGSNAERSLVHSHFFPQALSHTHPTLYPTHWTFITYLRRARTTSNKFSKFLTTTKCVCVCVFTLTRSRTLLAPNVLKLIPIFLNNPFNKLGAWKILFSQTRILILCTFRIVFFLVLMTLRREWTCVINSYRDQGFFFLPLLYDKENKK